MNIQSSPLRLFVVETMGSGGMIHYAYQLCTALAQVGVDVTLVTTVDYELRELPHNFAIAPLLRLWPMFDPRAGNRPASGLQKWLYKLGWTARRGWRAWRLGWEWVRLTRYLLQQDRS